MCPDSLPKDRAPSRPRRIRRSTSSPIHPNYFETFEVRLVRGRAFTVADREGAPDVAIVSEDVAARTWPGTIRSASGSRWAALTDRDPVVHGCRRRRHDALPRSCETAAHALSSRRTVSNDRADAGLRTTASLDLVASLARERINAVDPDVHVMRVAPFHGHARRPLARPRFNAFLLSVFGIAALLLSTIGLYAVMAAYVRQRDREIALRLALGATATPCVRFVLAEALWLAGLGAVIGLAGLQARLVSCAACCSRLILLIRRASLARRCS